MSKTKRYFKDQKYPLRQRGQNFLVRKKAIKKIVKAADLNEKDTVLEIGSGTGNLTKFLLKANKVIAVEIDDFLYNILKKRFENKKQIKIENEDIRDLNLDSLGLKDYKVIANIPFNITGLLIRKLLTYKNQADSIVLVVQKQVGKRIIADPPNNSLLSISVKFFGKPEIVSYLSKNNFWPRPKVDSAILKITPKKRFSISRKKFFKVVKAGFRHPRKYLLNNLSISGIIKKEKGKDIFNKINLDSRIRAERLELKDWVNLTKKFFKNS